jgi:hypothetical protein
LLGFFGNLIAGAPGTFGAEGAAGDIFDVMGFAL